MNENHLQVLYKLLGHEDAFSRMGSLDYSTNKYENKVVKGLEEVLAYARQWDGKRNIFIGRARRNSNGEVSSCNVITFDIDPIRPKGVASSDDQHLSAINAAKRILALYPGGYIASSGNGCLLVYYARDISSTIDNYLQREAILIRELQKKVEDLNVKIDSTNYPEAVIKAIGTQSTKGDIKYRRLSRWLDYPFQPFHSCSKLLERLSSIVPVQQTSIQGIDLKEVMSRFNGDRSVADFHLVTYLKQAGVGPEDAIKALQSNPIGRKEERPDDWTRLITKIYGSSYKAVGVKPISYFDQLFQKDSGPGNAIRTGFRCLDEALGSLPSGEISTFAARSGFGKSSFACTVSEYLRKKGKKILYFSTEMDERYIMAKFVAVATGTSLKKLLHKELTEQAAKSIHLYEEEFKKFGIKICDEFQPTLDKVKNEIIAYKPDIVIFDHITLIDTQWEKIAHFTRELKKIAKEENIPILNLAMLSDPPRGKDGAELPSTRSDVRGTKEILYLSAIFCFLSNQFEVKTNYQPVEFNIAKHRYGISGQKVLLHCNQETGEYVER